jgi:hypothetical protein
MQSNGGLTDARRFQGKDSILSGPAGRIVGAVRTSLAAGFERIIGFDMGGTSTDVSHYAGEFERVFETEVAGVRMRAPMMGIHTVAAGGGSILHFDGARYRVGPDSAAANPGPACYRRGGPLAVTDAKVMLGKIQPEHFPRVFGPLRIKNMAQSRVDVLATADLWDPAWISYDRRFPIGTATMGIFTMNPVFANQDKSKVFTCGTTDWIAGLRKTDAWNAVCQITANLLTRLSKAAS